MIRYNFILVLNLLLYKENKILLYELKYYLEFLIERVVSVYIFEGEFLCFF